MMDVVVGEEDAESLLELKEGEEEDDAVVKSITKADVEELLGGTLEEDEEEDKQMVGPKESEAIQGGEGDRKEENGVPGDSSDKSVVNSLDEGSVLDKQVKDSRSLPSLLPACDLRGASSSLRGSRFPPHRPLLRFFPPRRLPPPFHPFGGVPPPFLRPPMRRPPPHALIRHEPRFMPPPPRHHYNSVSKALSIARIVVQKKLKAEAEEEAKSKTTPAPSTTTTTKPLQSLMSIKTSLPVKLQRPLLPPPPPPRPLKRPLQEPKRPVPAGPPASVSPLRGGPGQVHSNLRRIQTVDEPPPPKRYSVSDQLKAVSIAHKPSPTLTRINIDPGPPPNGGESTHAGKKGTRIKISNLPASATFEKMCSMTTACGSVKTINILAEDNSAVIEFMDTQGAETFYRLNNRKMMDLSILNISMI